MTEVEHARWIDSDAVTRERDPEAWGELDLRDGGIQVWRRAGFSLAEATRWMDTVCDVVAGDEDVDDQDEAVKSALASACIVAGLEPSEAKSWGRVLPWRNCLDLPREVVEWRAAGFTPEQARLWSAREDIASASLLVNGGWSPEERDLLDAWLGVHGNQDRRVEWLGIPAPPAHVLDYVRADLEPREAAYHERARREGRDVTADLRHRAATRELTDEPAVRRLAVLTERLGSNREGLHADPLPRLGPLTGGLTNTPESPLTADFPVPEWTGESLGSELGTYQRGYGEWADYGPPEDSACPPLLAWTESHHDLVTTAYTRRWGEFLSPGGNYEVSWPPEGSLWDAGYALEGEAWLCERHGDDYDETCEECPPPESREETVEPAEWHWYVTVTTMEQREDELVDEGFERVHIMTTLMDPRIVEHTEAGVRPGDYY